MSKSSDTENSASDFSSEDDEAEQETGRAVPEIEFKPHLTPDVAQQTQPDESFRTRHPLFDAPELIDDKDELNVQEKLSSDDENDEVENQGELSKLVPFEEQPENEADIPEWCRFSLPQTPEPDDTEIDAAIQEKFSIPKLLQQIRSA